MTENIKVSDLPEQEQRELIAEAYNVGLTGFNFTSYKVETLKNKIAEQKKKNESQKRGDEQKGSNDEQKGSTDEQKDLTDEQKGSTDEQKGSTDEEKAKGENKTDETGETIVAGDGGTFNENGESKAKEEQKTQKQAKNEQKTKSENKSAEPTPAPATKCDGICHICRSKVINGVCTGCGFHK